jgi:hypothetical protein
MSVLKHEWIIMVESNSAHDIEQLYIDSGIFSFNIVKIGPLKNYQDIVSNLCLIFSFTFCIFYIFIENHATIT